VFRASKEKPVFKVLPVSLEKPVLKVKPGSKELRGKQDLKEKPVSRATQAHKAQLV
jgi:hypothetical protein